MAGFSMADGRRDAWLQWCRPWALMHRSWWPLGHDRWVKAGATEYWLRLHYAEWCARYGLSAEPPPVMTCSGGGDDPAWRLLALPSAAFDRCLQLVGWTVYVAAFPQDRVVFGKGALGLPEMRWCLSRAPLVPPALASMLPCGDGAGGGDGGRPVPWESMAAQLMHVWLRPAAPAIWARLRLRLHCDAAVDLGMGTGDTTALGALGGRLWRAALREMASETAGERRA